MVTEDGMLTKWERKILLDKLHGVEVKPEHLRAVKHRVKKRLLEAVKDLHLILSVFPDLRNVTGVTNGLMRGWDFHQNLPVRGGYFNKFLNTRKLKSMRNFQISNYGSYMIILRLNPLTEHFPLGPLHREGDAKSREYLARIRKNGPGCNDSHRSSTETSTVMSIARLIKLPTAS